MPKLSARALVSALPYAIKARDEEIAYRIYMSDCLMSATVALTRTREMPQRYADWILPKKPQPDSEKIKNDVLARLKKFDAGGEEQ